MTYQDMLVLVDDTPASMARATIATGLAAMLDAQITGAALKSTFLLNYVAAEAVTYLSPALIDSLIKEHDQTVERRCEDARMAFERIAAQSVVRSDWRVLEGDDDAELVRCARRHDLTVAPRLMKAPLGDRQITAGDLALKLGGPVLVVPDLASAQSEVGRNILVAWKGTRESARALHDAWPLITQADSVRFLIVSPNGDEGPDGLLQRHLEHHGLTADIVVDRSDDDAAAAIIRRHVASLKPDLLVMGLYGRSRTSERVFGGVSRDLVGDPPIPMLVSH